MPPTEKNDQQLQDIPLQEAIQTKPPTSHQAMGTSFVAPFQTRNQYITYTLRQIPNALILRPRPR